jgi:hypothetical protein
MAKIAAIRGRYENFQAFLARIAEDEKAVGFIGMVVRIGEDGERDLHRVNFKCTRAECAFGSLILGQMALEEDAEEAGRGKAS